MLDLILVQAAPRLAPPLLKAAATVSTYEHWSLIWYAVSAFAATCTLIVVVVAAWLTWGQIREAVKSRQVSSTLAIIEYMDDADLRNARSLLYDPAFCNTLEGAVPQPWSAEAPAAMDAFIQKVSGGQVRWREFRSWLGSLENISVLVMHDLAPDGIVDLYFRKSVQRHWSGLQPLISSLRVWYGNNEFLQHLEMLNLFIQSGGFERSAAARRRLKRTILATRERAPGGPL
jgi:hypothetical protein